MTKPTYEELETEIKKLRSRLSFGEDEEFTTLIKGWMPEKKALEKYERRGIYVMRPQEMWEALGINAEPSTTELAKLGRSLQALGWARSAQRGNLVFKMPVEDYASQN